MCRRPLRAILMREAQSQTCIAGTPLAAWWPVATNSREMSETCVERLKWYGNGRQCGQEEEEKTLAAPG